MTDKLRPDELEAFKAAFDMFDKNQDGTISTKVRRIRGRYRFPGLATEKKPFFFSFFDISIHWTVPRIRFCSTLSHLGSLSPMCDKVCRRSFFPSSGDWVCIGNWEILHLGIEIAPPTPTVSEPLNPKLFHLLLSVSSHRVCERQRGQNSSARFVPQIEKSSGGIRMSE